MDAATTPAPDLASLRRSRIDILERLIAFAIQWLNGHRSDGEGSLKAILRGVNDFVRISRWVRVAIFLCRRIADGALDAPRPPKKVRRPAGDLDDCDAEAAVDRELADDDRALADQLRLDLGYREPREFEHMEC